jgi:hypothetical protein
VNIYRVVISTVNILKNEPFKMDSQASAGGSKVQGGRGSDPKHSCVSAPLFKTIKLNTTYFSETILLLPSVRTDSHRSISELKFPKPNKKRR